MHVFVKMLVVVANVFFVLLQHDGGSITNVGSGADLFKIISI